MDEKEQALYIEKMRKSVISYTIATNVGYKPTRFHRMLGRILENVKDGLYQEKIVVIHAPPRLGKTTIVSKTGPAWISGHFPWIKTIVASNTPDLAGEITLALREKVSSPIHRAVFGESATIGSKASAEEFNLKGGGAVLAKSMLSTVIGKGANLLILDDPMTKFTDVQRESYRLEVQNKFRELYTRMDSGFRCVIVIMQRWHKDDLIGFLLREFPDKVVHFRFPAVIETEEDMLEDSMRRNIGDVICPELFSFEQMMDIKRIQGVEYWVSKYQGRPLYSEGMQFKSEFITRTPMDPRWASENMNIYLLGDPSGGKNAKSDYSAFFIIGLRGDKTFHILDGVRDRLSLRERWQKYRDLYKKWHPIECWYEQYGASADLDYFKEQMQAEKIHITIQNSAYLGHNSRKLTAEDKNQKHIRIERLIPDMIDGRWFAPEKLEVRRLNEAGEEETYDPVSDMVREEFPDYPNANVDDGLDCISRINDLPDLKWPDEDNENSDAPKIVLSTRPW